MPPHRHMIHDKGINDDQYQQNDQDVRNPVILGKYHCEQVDDDHQRRSLGNGQPDGGWLETVFHGNFTVAEFLVYDQ
ncbi:hypothetical protein D3C74_457910 [compost metagenome]